MSGSEGNLPTDVTSFVGRRHETSQGKALLSTTRLLTLTGVGGVGKTRLALHIAGEVARAFPDGVWLVELAPLRDEEFLVATVCTALGFSVPTGAAPLAQLSEHLAGQRLLIVLDNCEHMIESCAVLARKLLGTVPGLRILATSRQALGIDGESLLTVPPLPVPTPDAPVSVNALMRSEAVRLFVERATAVRPDFALTPVNSDAVARICQRLDGIPLAIELAAAWVRTLPVESIVERLDRQFRLLTNGDLGALPRHRTLRAAIEWSYQLCSPLEKLLWARMSVFVGVCQLEAIEQVCSSDGISTYDVFDLVAGLIDKSIALRDGHEPHSRYRLLEVVREFGDDMLAISGETASVRARHWDYYRRLARQAEAEWFTTHQMQWFDWMHREQPNLRTALEYSLTTPRQAFTSLETAAALYSPWVITGALREGTRSLRRALALNPEPTPARAKALHGCAYLLAVLGDIDDALAMLRECRTLGEQLDDAPALAYSTLRTGLVKMYQGDMSGAVPLLEEALAALRRLDDRIGIYWALHHLSAATITADDPRAEAFGQECLALCESQGAELSRSWALWLVGLQLWRRGHTEQAVSALSEALKLKSLVRELFGEAHCLEVLSWTAADTGDMKRAARLLGAANATWRRVGTSLVVFGYLERLRSPVEQRVREALGDEAYATLLAEGGRLDTEDAISFALGRGSADAAPSGTAQDLSPLTKREHEVAQLVGQGLSNKEIADTLVIAQRTAEVHVEHILSKLGFNSRTQIALWTVARRSNE